MFLFLNNIFFYFSCILSYYVTPCILVALLPLLVLKSLRRKCRMISPVEVHLRWITEEIEHCICALLDGGEMQFSKGESDL